MSKGVQLYDADGKVFAYPYYQIGDLYLTTRSTNPSTIFGGIWELFGKGRVLVCVDPEQEEFNTVLQTGGTKTHALTIDEMPSHRHELGDAIYGGDNNMLGVRGDGGGSWHKIPTYSQTTGHSSYRVLNTGGGKEHPNLPPYITCFIWIRIA